MRLRAFEALVDVGWFFGLYDRKPVPCGGRALESFPELGLGLSKRISSRLGALGAQQNFSRLQTGY